MRGPAPPVEATVAEAPAFREGPLRVLQAQQVTPARGLVAQAGAPLRRADTALVVRPPLFARRGFYASTYATIVICRRAVT